MVFAAVSYLVLTVKVTSVARIFCNTLESLGVSHIFGLPGSRTIEFFEQLEQSSIETIVPTHELGAAFMAQGYFRATGLPGVVLTIPGPGFTYALTGLAEAKLDSAAILHVTTRISERSDHNYQLQRIDQAAVAKPLVKKVFIVENADRLAQTICAAYSYTQEGEPGPVLLELSTDALQTNVQNVAEDRGFVCHKPAMLESAEFVPAIDRILRSRRPVLWAGMGAVDAASHLNAVVEKIRAPVMTTTSGRGVVPEDDRWSLGREFEQASANVISSLFSECDLIVALGCKFSHNATRGYRVQYAGDKLIHVDIDQDVLDRNSGASLSVHADVGEFLRELLAKCAGAKHAGSEWQQDDIDRFKKRAEKDSWMSGTEPQLLGQNPDLFFNVLRGCLPRDACLVADSGLHQMMVRRYWPVLVSRGLIVPADFQSMGYAIPTAIGAKLADPSRTVVAVVGDGAFLMSGLELLTAIKHDIRILVIVFNDGAFGLIRRSQIASFGRAPGSELRNPDFQKLAAGMGVNFVKLGEDLRDGLQQALQLPGTTLVEVTATYRGSQAIARTKSLVRRSSFGRVLGRLRRHLRS